MRSQLRHELPALAGRWGQLARAKPPSGSSCLAERPESVLKRLKLPAHCTALNRNIAPWQTWGNHPCCTSLLPIAIYHSNSTVNVHSAGLLSESDDDQYILIARHG